MADRKVVNKYYPPDFDPSAVKRLRRPKGQVNRTEVRLMLPFTICCLKCNEYTYKGKKFNGQKEPIKGEAYLGIQLYRFIITCPSCSNEITFRTDLKTMDYVMEKGAKRNYEGLILRGEKQEDDEKKRLKTEEEKDGMKKLENKAMAIKREMEMEEEIERLRAEAERRFRQEKGEKEDKNVKRWDPTAEAEQDEEEIVRKAFQAKRDKEKNGDGNDKESRADIERMAQKLLEIGEEIEENEGQHTAAESRNNGNAQHELDQADGFFGYSASGSGSGSGSLFDFSSNGSDMGIGGIVVKKRKEMTKQPENMTKQQDNSKRTKIDEKEESTIPNVASVSSAHAPVASAPAPSLSSLMAGYSDSEDEEQ